MNTSYTREFLELLDPRADSFTFQTYPDPKHITRGSCLLHGTLVKHEHTLDRENRLGNGVSVAVNETDLKGRKEENITRVRAVWQDDDGPKVLDERSSDKGFEGDLPLEPSAGGTQRFPLEPTLEIETSPGKFHRYWVIDPEYGEMSFETFDRVMGVITHFYGGDPNAKDLARVLRLPGTKNMKLFGRNRPIATAEILL